MANTSAPFGFRQYSGTGSVPDDGTVGPQDCLWQYERDLLRRRRHSALDRLHRQGHVASTVRVEGIFIGCKYFSTAQKRTVWSNYWPGSDATGDVEAYIISDPNAQFVVQAGGTNAIGFANIGEFIS
jgi:hypothetical protein